MKLKFKLVRNLSGKNANTRRMIWSLAFLLMSPIGQVDLFLENLSRLTKEEEQIQHFRSILDKWVHWSVVLLVNLPAAESEEVFSEYLSTK